MGGVVGGIGRFPDKNVQKWSFLTFLGPKIISLKVQWLRQGNPLRVWKPIFGDWDLICVGHRQYIEGLLKQYAIGRFVNNSKKCGVLIYSPFRNVSEGLSPNRFL